MIAVAPLVRLPELFSPELLLQRKCDCKTKCQVLSRRPLHSRTLGPQPRLAGWALRTQAVQPSPRVPGHCHPPQRKPVPTGELLRCLPPPALVTPTLPSVSVDLTVPDVSHKWNHSICDLSYLAAFTQCDVLGACRVAAFTPFMANDVPLSEQTSFVRPFTS